MGKKDDWCSCQGLKNRKAGMEKKEKACNKVCFAIMFVAGALVSLGIGGLQLERY